MNANANEFVMNKSTSNTRIKRRNVELERRNVELEGRIKELEAHNSELEKNVNESIDAIFMYEMKISELMKQTKQLQ